MADIRTVSWRMAFTAVAAFTLIISAVFVIVRSDGLPAVDATASRATRWFVHQGTGRVVLVDGFSGRALARLDTGADGAPIGVAEGAAGAYLLNRTTAEARIIDNSALRLGPPMPVAPLTARQPLVGVARNGLTVVDPETSDGVVVSDTGEVVPFAVTLGASGLVASDGAVWTVSGNDLIRSGPTGERIVSLGTNDVEMTLLGPTAAVLDASRRRVRLSDGGWIELDSQSAPSEFVLQVPGPTARCAWVGADGVLWCVSRDGIEERIEIPGLDLDGGDRLAVGGGAAALIRQNPPSIIRLDLRDATVLASPTASVPSDASLEPTATADLVWVDDAEGDLLWAVHPWGINAIRKNDDTTPLLGESGEVIAGGSSSSPAGAGLDDGDVAADDDRTPDDNGIDDPPVAVDDPVSARAGTTVPVSVIANDYDPDGEAIVVVSTTQPAHGSVELASGSSVVYQPEPGYIGLDQFDYTIVDGDGTEASATVLVELLSPDAPNQSPVAANDTSETGSDTAVVIEVLLNDIDPERDALRIGSFTPPDVGGDVSETIGPSGLPALRFDPPPGASGTATFTYRPVDSFDAVGEPASVTVEIAQPTDENRPPITEPDGVRARQNIPVVVPVLANDRDPDGDLLTVSTLEPGPSGIDVSVVGNELEVIARAGAARLTPFDYRVDDGHGHVVRGSVLVLTIADDEPNRPPLVNSDLATAVVGTTQVVDVLANDSDPDGDPLTVTGVTQPDRSAGVAAVQGRKVQFTPGADIDVERATTVKFSYLVSDGNGHEVEGEVNVRVLPEALPEPPFARDDVVNTDRDVAVTLDVLSNDGDPSGERPNLVGTPSCPGGGRATVSADERVTYVPPADRVGVFRCTYEVTNQRNLRASASIVINVIEPPVRNAPPLVSDEERTVEIGETILIDVLANDRDPDGPASELRVLSSTTPTLGIATRTGRTIRFEAGPALGVTVITYQVGDADGGVSTGRVVVQIVEPVPIPPVAVDDRRSIQGPGFATTIRVLDNDADPDGASDQLRVTGASILAGDATITNTTTLVTITPAPSFVGVVRAQYSIVDPDGLVDSANIDLTVLEPLNRPPVAVDDSAQVVNGGSVDVAILFNDTEPDGDPLTVTITGGPDPALGTAQLRADRTLRFVAQPGASGTAVISYEINDGELSARAVVRITVLPCTQGIPNAPDLFLQTGYQEPIFIDLAQQSSNGTVVDVGPPLSAPSGVYTPPAGENGNITIGYAVQNSCGLRDTGVVTVDVNQQPIAQPRSFSVGLGAQLVVPVSDLATDREPLTITGLQGGPTWITVADGGKSLLIDPGATGDTSANAAVAISDPGGLSVSVPVAVSVSNRLPVANADRIVAQPGSSVSVKLTANDTDADPGHQAALVISAIPAQVVINGQTVTLTVTGSDLSFTAPPLRGTATFDYRVQDPRGGESAPAVVTIVVNGPPTAADTPVVAPIGVTTEVALVASDPDGDALTVTFGPIPSGWTVVAQGLRVSVTPPTTAAGTAQTIAYTVSDGALTATANLVITVPTPATTTTTTVPPTTTTVPPTTTTVPPTTTTVPPTTTTTSTIPGPAPS